MKMTREIVADISKANQLLTLLCEHMEREAPLHNAAVFLTIAVAHGEGKALEVKEIQKRTGMKSAALSRALGALGEWSYKGRPGLELVKTVPDYEDRRRKPMALTAKGEKLAAEIADLISS